MTPSKPWLPYGTMFYSQQMERKLSHTPPLVPSAEKLNRTLLVGSMAGRDTVAYPFCISVTYKFGFL